MDINDLPDYMSKFFDLDDRVISYSGVTMQIVELNSSRWSDDMRTYEPENAMYYLSKRRKNYTEAKRCFATHDEDIEYFNTRIYIVLIACVYIQQFNFVQ